jgi:hypothetical protein
VTPTAFAFALAAGAALLSLWILIRYAGFGPKTVAWACIHLVIACVLLLVVLPAAFDAIAGTGIRAIPYVQVFGVALPLLVYAFLTGGWTTRAAVAQLR